MPTPIYVREHLTFAGFTPAMLQPRHRSAAHPLDNLGLLPR